MDEEESFIEKGGIAGYLKRNYKDKTIGKEITPYVQSGLKILGDSYNDAMYQARRGLYGPHALVGSHAIDTIGKIIPDIPIDKGISHVAHNVLGIDKPLSDVTGQLGEIALTRKLIKSIPKNLVSTKVTPYTKGLNPVNKKKLINITEEVFSPENSLFNRLIKEKTSGSLKKGGLFDPNRSDATKLMYTSTRPSPPFIFNNKEYTETTLIPNYQPKLIKPRPVYTARATTIEGVEGPASHSQFRKVRETDVAGGVKDMISKTPLWKPSKTINVRTGGEILKGYRVHHEAPLAPSASIKAGLNDEARIEADLYMLENGMPQGNLVENLTVVPHDLHMPVLHKFIDSRLGKMDLNKLVEKYYPGKQIWELELWERKPIFDEYIKVVNESRQITYDFYRALAAYDLPKGATIETTINAALQLDNQKLELLIFDMLGRGGEKMDFASDFFSSINPTEPLQPAPKGRLEALLDTSKNIDELLIRLDNHERGLDMIIDRMMGMSSTAVKKKYKKGTVDYDPNVDQLDLAIKQVTPQIKDALIKKYADANNMSLEEIYTRLEAGWRVDFDNWSKPR